MMANYLSRGMIAALLVLSSISMADARDRDHHRGHRWTDSRFSRTIERDHDRNPNLAANFIRDSDFPTYVRGVGTYAGGLSAFRDKGNGIYVHQDGANGSGSVVVLAPKARIIEVNQTTGDTAFAPRNGCVMESGVCVIRGDR